MKRLTHVLIGTEHYSIKTDITYSHHIVVEGAVQSYSRQCYKISVSNGELQYIVSARLVFGYLNEDVLLSASIICSLRALALTPNGITPGLFSSRGLSGTSCRKLHYYHVNVYMS